MRCTDIPDEHPDPEKRHRQATEQNCRKALFNLGVMHFTGDQVPSNPQKAYTHFLLAAAQGEESATQALALATARLTPDQIAAAQEEAK